MTVTYLSRPSLFYHILNIWLISVWDVFLDQHYKLRPMMSSFKVNNITF